MPCVVCYFQIHQPHRLRRYSVFDAGPPYFDEAKNAEIIRKVADKCYRPATQVLLDLARRFDGRFKVAFSVTGTALDQLEAHAPDVIGHLRELVRAGSCEILAETSAHSLSFAYSPAEFEEQVVLHDRAITSIFGVTPTIFRNTELIYSNAVAARVAAMKDEESKPRYAGILCEGVDTLLAGRPPCVVYAPPGAPTGRHGKPLGLLLKNYSLSDDIAFRFGNRQWKHWPLSADKFAEWVAQTPTPLVNLFMDYETFGEHQWADTGIFQFLSALPEAVFARDKQAAFITPSEALARYAPSAEYNAPELTSWADAARDLSAWTANEMQRDALRAVYAIEERIKAARARARDDDERANTEALLADWRRLTTSDHFYYMSTKGGSEGQVHSYFRPYDSPYDAYITFMNVLGDLTHRIP
ncbi:MAG: glycoside hydrolase family 57 protein [Planctomycetes bacterium]|nr:glycoside hydrolase family 57 protein [Planctomycetota bacterium]